LNRWQHRKGSATFAAKSSPSLQMTVDELDISKDTLWKTVFEDLKKLEDCLCFVLHALTTEQEEDQVAACQGWIEMAQ
jgi:hypothetical protein